MCKSVDDKIRERLFDPLPIPPNTLKDTIMAIVNEETATLRSRVDRLEEEVVDHEFNPRHAWREREVSMPRRPVVTKAMDEHYLGLNRTFSKEQD